MQQAAASHALVQALLRCATARMAAAASDDELATARSALALLSGIADHDRGLSAILTHADDGALVAAAVRVAAAALAPPPDLARVLAASLALDLVGKLAHSYRAFALAASRCAELLAVVPLALRTAVGKEDGREALARRLCAEEAAGLSPAAAEVSQALEAALAEARARQQREEGAAVEGAAPEGAAEQQYCSVACAKAAWRGGHPEECLQAQRAAAAAAAAAATATVSGGQQQV
ncbi:MAG: hypothetical protein J3K34DRAFT_463791 [Monoraphidium minutum]|nr:MAG: hypothetical protein J3K34DRAFT_463791 [Monoraphidium minutum]